VFIRYTEYRPVPEQVQEDDHHRQGIIDTNPVVLFVLQFLSAHSAVVIRLQAFAQRKNTPVYKSIAFAAIRALHPYYARQQPWLFTCSAHIIPWLSGCKVTNIQA